MLLWSDSVLKSGWPFPLRSVYCLSTTLEGWDSAPQFLSLFQSLSGKTSKRSSVRNGSTQTTNPSWWWFKHFLELSWVKCIERSERNVPSSALCGCVVKAGRLHNMRARLLLLVMLSSLLFSFLKGKPGIVYSRPGNELGSIWKQSGKVCQQIFVK